MNQWTRIVLGLAIALGMLATGFVSAATPHPTTDNPAGATPSGELTATTPARFASSIHHVVLVLLENAEASTVLKHGPYEESLSDNYAYASLDYAICHPSAPNYLALTSGGTFTQCGSDAHHLYSGSNIGDLLAAKKESWASFSQSMPKACDTTDSYPYAVKHNPLVFYSDIQKNKSRCDAHDLTWASWTADVKAGSIPNFAFITPNLKNDGHDTGVAYADTWLKGWLTPLLKTTWARNTVFLITYDEGSTNAGYGHFAGGHVFLVAVSPYSPVAGLIASNSSHYSVLTTIEWLLGLGSNGRNDKASLNPPLQEMFSFA
ncbi:MAG: alkaline phosphatase family protein [Thermoplasmata archaeon]|nr:alkaline phosphatase family protein [Thermoplasmata archaeon]